MNVVHEFEQQLAAWQAEYAADPVEHLRQLWLVALEREQLVTVAYRPEVIGPRLARMGVSDALAAVIVPAIGWAWRDEQMHARYVRGVLLSAGDLPRRLRTWLTQLTGTIAGWTSSRQQHLRWREAPFTRSVAELIELAGALGGRLPEGARDHLHFDSFRNFCRFSVAAETTAAMGWAEMARVGKRAGLHAEHVRTFQRIEEDERRHAALFQRLTAAFTDDDRVVDGLTAATLRRDIAAIGQRFLTSPTDGDVAWDNPTGKGAVVDVHTSAHGTAPADALNALLDRIDFDALVAAHRPEGRPLRVALRATFMHAWHRDDRSVHVHPELIAALARRCAPAEVTVLEAPNIYDRFHSGREVREVARFLGLRDASYTVRDACAALDPHPYARGYGSARLCRLWREADLRLTLSKLRSHPVTGAMMSVDAAEGLSGRHDDTLFAEHTADRATAALAVLDAAPPHLSLVDALTDVPDGLLGMMGCPDPLQPRRLYASADSLSLDAVLHRHLGLRREHPFFATAVDWFGDPRPHLSVRGDDTAIEGFRTPDNTRLSALLARLSEPVFVHASGRGAAFIPPLDPVAFPPHEPPSAALLAARRLVGRVSGMPSAPTPRGELLRTRRPTLRGRRWRTAELGDGPPLLLLHGYPDTLQVHSRLARQLASEHRVLLVDWPGTGGSDPASGYGPRALARHLVDLLDAWGLDRVGIWAADMGAPPALCLAALHPERVAGIAVGNSLLFDDAPTSVQIRIMRRAGLAAMAFAATPRTVYQQCKQTFLPADVALPDVLDAELWQHFRRSEVRRTLARMCRAYDRELPRLPELYAQISCPVRTIWGADEHHFDREHGLRLAQLLPQAEHIDLPGAPHWMAWTHTDALHAQLRPFFGDLAWTS